MMFRYTLKNPCALALSLAILGQGILPMLPAGSRPVDILRDGISNSAHTSLRPENKGMSFTQYHQALNETSVHESALGQSLDMRQALNETMSQQQRQTYQKTQAKLNLIASTAPKHSRKTDPSVSALSLSASSQISGALKPAAISISTSQEISQPTASESRSVQQEKKAHQAQALQSLLIERRVRSEADYQKLVADSRPNEKNRKRADQHQEKPSQTKLSKKEHQKIEKTAEAALKQQAKAEKIALKKSAHPQEADASAKPDKIAQNKPEPLKLFGVFPLPFTQMKPQKQSAPRLAKMAKNPASLKTPQPLPVTAASQQKQKTNELHYEVSALAQETPLAPTAAVTVSTVEKTVVTETEKAPFPQVKQTEAKQVKTTAIQQSSVNLPLSNPIEKAGEIFNLMTTGAADQLSQLQELDSRPAQRPITQQPAPASRTAQLPPLIGGEANVRVLRSGVSSTLSEVDVTVNKAVILNLSKPAARVSISDPEIASALIISPTQIQLIGNQVGVANLLVWGSTSSPEHTMIDIQVHRDVSVLARQLQFVDTGIRVVPLAAEDTVILTGEAENRESAQLAVDLAKAFFKGGAPSGALPGGGGGKSAGSSSSPGSAFTGGIPNIINLLNIKGEPSTKLELARKRLRGLDPNIQLDIVPGQDGSEKAILTGRVKSSSLISKAINTTSVFYGQPGIKVISGPGGNSVRATSGDYSFPTNTAFSDNIDINVLQGSVITDTSGSVISMMEVAQKPQIKCSIQFVEVSKNNLDALGHAIFGIGNHYAFGSLSGAQSSPAGRAVSSLDQDQSGAAYASSFNTNGAARTNSLATGFSQAFSNGVTQVFQINEKFTAALSALEERRKARTLAEPTLTMLSGEKASFLAGGEVPIPVLGANGQVNVTYHEFGIRLNLVATYLDTGKIHLLVAPEISAIDPANGVNSGSVSVPGFRTRRMQSTLELEQGQSFILAGLYNQDEVWSVSRFPWAGSLPIIGSLMRNKWKSNNRTELVVIIKPEVAMLDAETNEPVGYSSANGQNPAAALTTVVPVADANAMQGAQKLGAGLPIRLESVSENP